MVGFDIRTAIRILIVGRPADMKPMKPMRWREVGLVIAGLLLGFAGGLYIFPIFLPPNTPGNGLAVFIAAGCNLVGSILMIGIRYDEPRPEHDAHTKHDA